MACLSVFRFDVAKASDGRKASSCLAWVVAACLMMADASESHSQPPPEAGDVVAEENPDAGGDATPPASDSATPKDKHEGLKNSERPLVLPPLTRPDPVQRSMGEWVQQLNDPRFLRREAATKKLIEAGTAAIPSLIQSLEEGDLETIERTIFVITEIAMSRPPADDGGAWDHLQRLASRAGGVRSAGAKAAIEEVRQSRSKQAKSFLTGAGVFIGIDEFIVRSTSRDQLMIRIDDKWNGEVAVLQWLRWLDGIEFARVSGKAARRDVLERLVEIPNLQTLAVTDATVDRDILVPLTTMSRIQALEFRYVRLSPELCDLIVTMPVRLSLNLMGTGVATDKVEQMRAALPGLQIDHKQGGFLGVICFESFAVCQISRIVPKSAAEAAGLIPGDVIVQIEATQVKQFKDLQEAINQHLPGDEIEVKFLRGDKVTSVRLQLRRLDQK